MYKLVAIDIDGTLLDPQGHIRPAVREAIRQALEGGCVVTLATGRRYSSARGVAQQLGLNTPLILYSGSLVYDTQAQRALLHRPLAAGFVQTAITILSELGVYPAVMQSPVRGERIFLGPVEHDSAYVRDYATHPHRAYLVERRRLPELATVEDPMVVVGLVAGRNLAQLLDHIRHSPRLACQLHAYHLLQSALPDLYGFDILPPGYSKAVALKWLAEYHGLTLAQTLVIGDGTNDIDMLKAAGLGVAMHNAAPEVKAAADVTVKSNAEDGVAEALQKYVLN